jgi:hypothetical protein
MAALHGPRMAITCEPYRATEPTSERLNVILQILVLLSYRVPSRDIPENNYYECSADYRGRSGMVVASIFRDLSH